MRTADSPTSVPVLPADVERVLIGEEELCDVVAQLAERIDRDFADRDEVVVVGALTGAVVVTSDVVRRLQVPVALDFVAVSSYGERSTSSGQLQWHKRLTVDIAGRDVLLIDDIVDSGLTLSRLQAALRAESPRSLRTAALLDKPERREVDVTVDYVGRVIPDEFVVGYGLDYAHRFRNLPYIGVLRPSAYR